MNKIVYAIIGFLVGLVLMSLLVIYWAPKSVEVWAQPVSLMLTLIIAILAFAAIETQVKLHREVYRPVVVCDFVVQYSVLYFRVKNFGTCRAFNISISFEEKGNNSGFNWKQLPPIADGISSLSPGAEVFYFFSRPGSYHFPNVQFILQYSNGHIRNFKETYEHDLSYLRKSDIGRENNAPVVKQLIEIQRTLEKLAKR